LKKLHFPFCTLPKMNNSFLFPWRIPFSNTDQLLGHKSEANTRKSAKALGIVITRGKMEVCKACALAKAKQKDMPIRNLCLKRSKCRFNVSTWTYPKSKS
jgi:hypothetical protein